MLGSNFIYSWKDKYNIFVTYKRSQNSYSKLSELPSENCFFNIDPFRDDKLKNIIIKCKPDFVVNCIGITKTLINKNLLPEYEYINSILPHDLNKICSNTSSKLILLSSDCVFSGKDGNYNEKSIPDANDNYGKTDIDNLRNAIKGLEPEGVFMTSVSPGCLVNYVPNDYYSSRDKYRAALTLAMRPEYELIDNAGFILQLDCPDLAGSRHTDQQDWSDKEFLREVEKSIEALNEATSNIAPENMRIHICWLNYSGPHTHDIPISKIIGALGKARPQGLLFEGANPRHEHEWEDWKEAKIPDDKILIPGVIDSTNNFVEHPRLVAQRICRYADIVGRERVIAGTDCGFSTYAGRKAVFPSVVLAKLRALAQGAKLATEKLW